MIYRSRTIPVHAEKLTEYRTLVLRAATYLNDHYPAVHVEILENVDGRQQQVHMVTRCDSLAALEAYEAQRKEDPDWKALGEEARALQATVESVDHLYRLAS